jgi:hypothetical protein
MCASHRSPPLIPLDIVEHPPEMATDGAAYCTDCTRGRPVNGSWSHVGAPIQTSQTGSPVGVELIFSGFPQTNRLADACQDLPPTCVLKGKR